MPYVHIQITDEGVTRPQKAELVARTTQMLTEILGKTADTTVVVMEEVPTDNWGIGGELVSARRARGATRPRLGSRNTPCWATKPTAGRHGTGETKR